MGSCEALYLHVPFCQRKCPYCDFYSLSLEHRQNKAELLDAYVQALCKCMEALPEASRKRGFSMGRLRSVYIGGGTPTVLGGARLARLLAAVDRHWGIEKDGEVTVECNPNSACKETFRDLKSAGVNRLSMGLQSADGNQLAFLGRLHSRGEAASGVEAALSCGIEHISLDLMLGLPGQTDREIADSVSFCAGLGAEHISAYLLKIEEGTPFAQAGSSLGCPDDDRQAQLYEGAVKALASAGYQQYEISNFCRNGRVARHNLTYWDCREYMGLGPSAHSFAGGRRFYFPKNLEAFLNAPEPLALVKEDGVGGDVVEYCMLRLRLTEGLCWETLAHRYPCFHPENLIEKARPIVKGGLAVCNSQGLRLTVKGFLVSNAVIGALLETC